MSAREFLPSSEESESASMEDSESSRELDESTHEPGTHIEQTGDIQTSEAIETVFMELVETNLGEMAIGKTPSEMPPTTNGYDADEVVSQKLIEPIPTEEDSEGGAAKGSKGISGGVSGMPPSAQQGETTGETQEGDGAGAAGATTSETPKDSFDSGDGGSEGGEPEGGGSKGSKGISGGVSGMPPSTQQGETTGETQEGDGAGAAGVTTSETPKDSFDSGDGGKSSIGSESYDAAKKYAGVVMSQGQVLEDSDWNEADGYGGETIHDSAQEPSGGFLESLNQALQKIEKIRMDSLEEIKEIQEKATELFEAETDRLKDKFGSDAPRISASEGNIMADPSQATPIVDLGDDDVMVDPSQLRLKDDNGDEEE